MLTNKNPVLKGFHPDPCILKVGNEYFLATSTFQWFGGVELYHSFDLVNWELLPSPLSKKSQLDMQGNPNSGGVWAPCISYDKGVFYLIYTNTKNFHGIFKDTHNYLVTSKNPHAGEWSEPIYLNSSGFDPSLFHDDDGKKYLLNMRWDHRMEKHDFAGILIQEYDENKKALVGEIKTIYRGTKIGATEAPHMFKKDGYYYLIVAEGGTMYNHGVRLARSKTLFGEYESDKMPLLTTRNNPEMYIQRTGHASYIETRDGGGYVAYLGTRPIRAEIKTGELGYSILGRETCIAPVKWENGWLRLENGTVIPPEEYTSNLDEHKFEKLPEKDVFNGEKLPLYYKTLRIPFENIASMSENKDALRLFGKESITSPNVQSMVARRLDSFEAEATAELEFEPKTFQQMAGLCAFYDTYNFFYLYMSRDEETEQNALRIVVRDSLKFYNPIDSYRVLIGQSKKVWLRVKINYLKLNFSYSLNGVDFFDIGNELNCSNLSDEAYVKIDHEGHTGTFVGMACQDLTGQGAHADFFSFEYKVK